MKENKKDPKFKIDNHVKLSKYKNIFAKGYVPLWSEEVYMIRKYYSVGVCNRRP